MITADFVKKSLDAANFVLTWSDRISSIYDKISNRKVDDSAGKRDGAINLPFELSKKDIDVLTAASQLIREIISKVK